MAPVFCSLRGGAGPKISGRGARADGPHDFDSPGKPGVRGLSLGGIRYSVQAPGGGPGQDRVIPNQPSPATAAGNCGGTVGVGGVARGWVDAVGAPGDLPCMGMHLRNRRVILVRAHRAIITIIIH